MSPNSYIALKRLTYLIVMIPTAWVVGLFVFINSIPESEVTAVPSADAVVVLTGGSMRMEQGIELFHKIKAKKLLISGVSPSMTKEKILAKFEKQNIANDIDPEQIILGTMAYNTDTNALEAKIFMHHHNFKSMVLVTSNYHIIRSMKIFASNMPDIKIIPYPICSNKFRKAGHFISLPSLQLATQEYNKLLFFYAQSLDKKATELSLQYLDLVYSLVHPILFETNRSQAE